MLVERRFAADAARYHFQKSIRQVMLSVQIGHCREVQGGCNEAVPQLSARFYLYYGNDAHGFVGII
jgi:hypothetical protein